MKKICFSLCLCVVFSATLRADDDDEAQKNHTAVKSLPTAQSQGSVFLDHATQVAAGLKTIKLKANTYRTELLSYGTAISIEPLLALQNQYLIALAQQSSAQAKAQFSQNNLNRLSYLHHEQIISTHALQDQQATLQADKAAFASSHYLSRQIINNAQLVWGAIISDWLIKPSAIFTDLIQQRRILLKITFPPESSIIRPLKTIFVAANGHREQAVKAEFISAVPQVDSFSQGQQYFYHIPSQNIKAGMRVSAWVPTQQQSQTGVIIPNSAVCWHLGQALVFIKIAEQQFISRTLSTYQKISDGYFVNSGLIAGEEIVSTGAQMLLSQAFKGQIPSENDD